MDTNTKIKLEDVIALLDKKYYLVNIDRGDNLNDNLKPVQKSIRDQDWSYLDESFDDWTCEASDYGVDYAVDKLKKQMKYNFEFVDGESADDIIEEYRYEIEDEIRNRDESNPIKDLISNTSFPVAFYDTGIETYDRQDSKEQLHDIKKALNIPQREKKYDKTIFELCNNSYYGGQLVVYFNCDIDDWMSIGDNNTISFKDANIAIINTCNGSGYNVQLEGHEFSLPLDLNNFFLDRIIKYSYTYDVCGMGSHWCDDTIVKFSKKKSKSKINGSPLNEHMKLEEKYNKTFKEGGCTSGDMNMSRHRGIYYLNEFPCGTHCPHCHTFWID